MCIAVTKQRGTWVRDLHVDVEQRVEPVCSPQLLDPAREELGRGAVDWAIRLGRDVAARAVLNFPEFGSGAPQLATLRLGTESAAIIAMLGIDRGDGETPEITEDAIRAIQDWVHRGIPLHIIWAAMRQGHSWLAEGYMRACVESVPIAEQPDQLQLTSEVLFNFVNRFSAAVGREYGAEHERWIMSTVAARDEVVRSILDGKITDTSDAENILHYTLSHRQHIGVVLWADTVDGASGSALHSSAMALLHAAGAEQTLLVPHGRHSMHGWGNSIRPLIGQGTDFPMLAAGVRAAVGTNHGGVDGFARTHEEAAASKRVTEILPGISEPIVDFPSVHLLTLLAQDKGKATYFVQAELSDLAGDDAQHSELRKTAIAYLRHRRSPLAAAQELFVVRNTVAYRLKRVEDLLGHSLDERTLETWAALVLKESLVCGTSATREELSSRP